jgi:acetate kinase
VDVLVVNAGSTSLKLHLVDAREQSTPLGQDDLADLGELAAVAHRVVHGGGRFRDPVPLDPAVLEQIAGLEEIAPLHNAPALHGIELARSLLPDVPQVAVFDTGFHRTIPPLASTYALPRHFREEWGVRRYGFHGLSLQWCAERAPALLERSGTDLRLVVCHLGGGCSVSALRNGRSLDTTMGFSPLDGVPMGTRSGAVDPGALLYLLNTGKLGVKQLEHALSCDSGLRGLAGGDGSMAALERSATEGDAEAKLAVELFAYRVAGAVAAMAVACRGVDALVFTAGIGEGSPAARERVCARLGFLGLELDASRNQATNGDRRIAASSSAVEVLVIHAREEVVAARAARALLRASEKRHRTNDRPAGGSGPIRGRE